MLLFNPASYDPTFLDDASRSAMQDLVAFFEAKGLAEMKDEYHAGTWYKDFLDFNAEQGLFAGVATPANVAALLEQVRDEAEHDAVRLARSIERSARESAEERARDAVVPAGGRLQVTTWQTPLKWVRLDSAPFTDRLVRKFRLPVTGWRGQ